jgi:hypothetical protein
MGTKYRSAESTIHLGWSGRGSGQVYMRKYWIRLFISNAGSGLLVLEAFSNTMQTGKYWGAIQLTRSMSRFCFWFIEWVECILRKILEAVVSSTQHLPIARSSNIITVGILNVLGQALSKLVVADGDAKTPVTTINLQFKSESKTGPHISHPFIHIPFIEIKQTLISA